MKHNYIYIGTVFVCVNFVRWLILPAETTTSTATITAKRSELLLRSVRGKTNRIMCRIAQTIGISRIFNHLLRIITLIIIGCPRMNDGKLFLHFAIRSHFAYVNAIKKYCLTATIFI